MNEKKRKKHADIIHAWAEGYTIEKLHPLCCDNKHAFWRVLDAPMFFEDMEYRVKADQGVNLEEGLHYNTKTQNWSEE
jgi:hypothetical protein